MPMQNASRPRQTSTTLATIKKREPSAISIHMVVTNFFTNPKSKDFAKSCTIEARSLRGVRTNIIARIMTKSPMMAPAAPLAWPSLPAKRKLGTSVIGTIKNDMTKAMPKVTTSVTRKGQTPRSRYFPNWLKSKSGKASGR